MSSKETDRKAVLQKVCLCVITDKKLSRGRSFEEVVEAAIRGGAQMIQFRDKEIPNGQFYNEALKLRILTQKAGALFMVNDRIDVALSVGADGVHLGQEDLPIRAARKIAPELIIGASSHNLMEALKAEQDGADYVNIGPIFPTKTKENTVSFLGPGAISEIGPQLTVPFTTMGGINPENIGLVLEAGARRVAMITGITRAADITARVRRLRKTIADYYDR